ncbi:MAG: VanW family protein [Nannocystaceae bacterium]
MHSVARIAPAEDVDVGWEPVGAQPVHLPGHAQKTPTPCPSAKHRWWRSLLPVLAVGETLAMFIAAASTAAWLAGAYERGLADERTFPGVRLHGASAGKLDFGQMFDVAERAAQRQLDQPIDLRAGGMGVRATARQLGAQPQPAASAAAAHRVGRSGLVFRDLRERARARRGQIDVRGGFLFDEPTALELLLELAPRVERPSLPTRLIAAERRLVPAVRGTTLLPYDSLSNVAIGLASRAREIDLAVQAKAAVDDPLAARVDARDVSTLLGTFSTPYSMGKERSDRTHNLKVGAASLENFVLQPGQTFSFNEVVGDRSADAGYRYAAGLAGGEVVDVLGGGICQISSTLFGAAFFAGLELVSARPHSRPSSYVDMGLDSTVVYPTVDMRLRNPYDHPVVFHMTVRQGHVRAEILGRERGFQIAFEREVTEVLPYRTVYRDDDRLQIGSEVVVQRGMRGFEMTRIRERLRAGERVSVEKWPLRYPPTRRIVRRGTSAAGEVPKATSPRPFRDPVKGLRIVQ